MAKKQKVKKKRSVDARLDQTRLVRGRDWHAWAFYEARQRPRHPGIGMCYWAEVSRPKEKPSPDGKWVRVRFVRVRER